MTFSKFYFGSSLLLLLHSGCMARFEPESARLGTCVRSALYVLVRWRARETAEGGVSGHYPTESPTYLSLCNLISHLPQASEIEWNQINKSNKLVRVRGCGRAGGKDGSACIVLRCGLGTWDCCCVCQVASSFPFGLPPFAFSAMWCDVKRVRSSPITRL